MCMCFGAGPEAGLRPRNPTQLKQNGIPGKTIVKVQGLRRFKLNDACLSAYRIPFALGLQARSSTNVQQSKIHLLLIDGPFCCRQCFSDMFFSTCSSARVQSTIHLIARQQVQREKRSHDLQLGMQHGLLSSTKAVAYRWGPHSPRQTCDTFHMGTVMMYRGWQMVGISGLA